MWYMVPRSSGPHSIGMTMISNPCGGSSCGPAYSVSLLTEKTQHMTLDFEFSLTLRNQVWIGLMLCRLHLMRRFNNLSLLNLFASYMAYTSHYITAMPLLPTMSIAIWKGFITNSGMVWTKCSSVSMRWVTSNFVILSERVARMKYVDGGKVAFLNFRECREIHISILQLELASLCQAKL